MKFDEKNLLLYAITDSAWVGRQTLLEQIEDALKGGITCLQLREKNMNEADFLKEATQAVRLCRRYNVPLIINDNVDIAIKSGADGVHVGIEDCPVCEIRKKVGADFIIGATAKTVEQAQRAQAEGADYLGVGAVFPSPTKATAIRITHEKLKEICASVSIPAVAIGGIEKGKIPLLAGSGAKGIAVVSAVFAARDIESECRELRCLAEEHIVNNGKMALKKVLTIAGSDSSGGAGIQADIKTMTANGVYAMSAITALTAQNTMGVFAVSEVSSEFLKQQIDCVFEDIRPDAVKIGMVSSAELMTVIAERLEFYRAENVVVDPVMVATSGSRLMQTEALSALKEMLLPLATLMTPNIPEAEALTGMRINNRNDMETAARRMAGEFNCSVLLKGGHSVNDANDLLYSNGECLWIEGKRIDNPNTHGTGCTLSSAIASNLAKEFALEESVCRAKDYVSGALAAMLDLGKGSGPMNHMYTFIK